MSERPCNVVSRRMLACTASALVTSVAARTVGTAGGGAAAATRCGAVRPGRARRPLPLQDHACAPVARDPQRRLAVLLAAATCEDDDDEEEGDTFHGKAFDRTAPSSVARTSSPRCGPTQPTAAWVEPCVRAVRLLPTGRT